jgi:serine/threonine-protein kinase
MSLWSWLCNLASKIPTSAIGAITGPAKELSGAAKDITSVRRDLVETQIAKKKLEEYESQVQRANFDDVKEYDPKTRHIIAAGRYEIRDILGRGGFGTVYFATDLRTGRQVVIKRLAKGGEPLALLNESTVLRRLSHANIVALLDVIEEEGATELVMEYVEGRTLDQIIREHSPSELMPFLLRVLPQIASALDYAHGLRIMHLEVKPANIIVENDGTTKLIDFGIARMITGDRGTFAGTPLYMAPEQWTMAGQDGRTDQYALGLVAYQLLTGRLPFDGHTMAEIGRKVLYEPPPSPLLFSPELGARVEDIMRRVLSKNPAHRFSTCSEFAQALIAGLPQ